MQFSEVQKLNHCVVAMLRNSKENMGGIKTQTIQTPKTMKTILLNLWFLIGSAFYIRPIFLGKSGGIKTQTCILY